MANPIMYIISDLNHSKYFEWVASQWDKHIDAPLEVILINGSGGSLHKYLSNIGVPVHVVNVTSRWSWRGMKSIKQILLQRNPSIVHTHLLTANILGLVSAKRAGIHQRMHTRHHSTFHHDYHPRWVRVDRWLGGLSKKVVAISEVVARVLIEREQIPNEKVVRIPHGFHLDWFNAAQKEVDGLREAWSVQEKFVVGVVSRMMELKGIRDIVDGFKIYSATNPNAVLVFIGTAGPDRVDLIEYIMNELNASQYRLLDHVQDMNVAYRSCDCVLHVPVTSEIEAFGQIYVEAMASEVPLVCTLSGIGNELVKDNENAIVVMHQSPEEISDALSQISSDQSLRLKLAANAKASVHKYRIEAHMNKLQELYV